MRKMMAVIVSGVLLLSACQGIMAPDVAYNKKLAPWVGRSADDLYNVWGYPSQTSPIDDDTIMVTYNLVSATPVDGDPMPYADEINYEAMAVPSFGIAGVPGPYYCQTNFIIKQGVVTGYNFSGDDCI